MVATSSIEYLFFLTKRNIRKYFCILLLLMQNVLLFLKNERYIVWSIFLLKKREKKILVSCFWLKCIVILLIFYVRGAPWILWGSMEIRMEGSFSPQQTGTNLRKQIGVTLLSYIFTVASTWMSILPPLYTNANHETNFFHKCFVHN
jgi:hypothetical protein